MRYLHSQEVSHSPNPGVAPTTLPSGPTRRPVRIPNAGRVHCRASKRHLDRAHRALGWGLSRERRGVRGRRAVPAPRPHLGYVVRFDNLPEPTVKKTDRLFTSGLQVNV